MKRWTLPLVLVGLFCWGSASADLTPMEQLGKDLFFDNNLSTPSGQSCAACHAPNTAFAGPISEINAHGAVYPGAVFTRFGNRKPPTSAYASFSPDFYFDETEGLYVGGMFWDGRALNTTEQAKGPFLNPVEQNNPNQRHVVSKVVKGSYSGLFEQVYAEWSMMATVDGVKMAKLSFDLGDDAFIANAYQLIAEAIAAYEASSEVNQFSSKYDAYLAGDAMLTAQEAWGLDLFEGKAMCSACHPSQAMNGDPPLFTDFTYDNLGVPRNPENPWYTMPSGFNPDGADWTDYGLGGRLGEAGEMGKMKVPTLRNVGMRPYEGFVQAYTHNGFFKSLEDIVHFYNTRDVAMWPAPEVAANVNTDELGDLGLTADEEAAVVAFMNTLTDGWTGDGMAAQAAVPRILLGGSRPNPFHGATEITFTLPGAAAVNLDVFDVAGRQVRRLLTESRPAGLHTVVWDATNDQGRRVAPGVYFYRLKADREANVQRVVLLP
jgi:cytochrome c peroxidase